jgi:hypothetical protein
MSNDATAAQRRRFDKIAALCCLPCQLDGVYGTPATVSHCHDHGNRNHAKVYPCCPQHHLATFAVPGIPNRHATPEEFKARYGSDDELHELTCRLLGETE